MLIDTHIHTKEFSGDAILSRSDLVSYNDRHPSCIFCTTEHYDYDYPYRKHQLICDLDHYDSACQDSKARYEEKMQKEYPILFGIEFGYMENLGKYYDNLSKQYPFDSIICSVHYFNHNDPYFNRYFYKSAGKKAVYGGYLESIVHSLENCDGFDIVGHFDYISRYAPYPDKKIYYRDFPDLFDTIFTLCIQKGKALEVNTRVPAQFKAEAMPDYMFDPDILIRYKELGGELISLGSDAHTPDSLMMLFDETKDMLRKVGFRHLVYYRKRSPVCLPL